MPPRHVVPLCLGLLLSAARADAQPAPGATTLPPPLLPATTDPFDICALSVTRLVFTLADLQTRNCGSDDKCNSLCWCRTWASSPVTATTLALCVPANNTSQCVGDSRDCKAVLPTPTPPTPTPSSKTNNNNSQALNTIDNSIKNDETANHKNGISTTTSIAVATVCVAVLVLLLFAANWYRNRPRSISAPATVSGGIQRSGPSLGSTELDTFDEKLPSESRPTYRGSLAALGPMHFDANASIISGVSGASYHDIDGTHLGHVNEAHALTDTELSLSKDKNERVFSPVSADGGASEIAFDESFMSNDSSIAIVPLGHRVGTEQYYRLQQEHRDPYGGPSASSSFVSDTSTTYLTNNESFSSQLTVPGHNESFMSQVTIPESDDGSEPREVEF